MVWVALFFCGCYLPAMTLAQQRENRTIYSLATTPVGWSGVGLSTSGCYFALTAIVSLSLAIALGYRPGVSLWATVLLAAAVYVAVGFTLGSWCDTAASTRAGMLVYLALSGLFALIVQSVLGLQSASASVELQVVQRLQETPTGLEIVPWSLAVWVLVWSLLARLSFGRVKTQ